MQLTRTVYYLERSLEEYMERISSQRVIFELMVLRKTKWNQNFKTEGNQNF